MLAIIHRTIGVRKAFWYNEKKIDQGVARCLSALPDPGGTGDLPRSDRLKTLTDRTGLNSTIRKNGLHISLNFHPLDSLDEERMRAISEEYISRTSLAEQPCLVYRHSDAAHPHLHLVSCLIRENGKPLKFRGGLREQSRKACRELDALYGLTPSNPSGKNLPKEIPEHFPALRYGSGPSFESLDRVVHQVTRTYCFDSLNSLGAALRLYRVSVHPSHPGPDGKPRGLIYRMLDTTGHRTGVWAKASALPGKPTIPFLETRFEENRILKADRSRRVRAVLDWMVIRPPEGLIQISRDLGKEGVSILVAIPRNQDGFQFYYIDLKTRTVFADLELGPSFRAGKLLERCGLNLSPNELVVQSKTLSHRKTGPGMNWFPMEYPFGDHSPLMEFRPRHLRLKVEGWPACQITQS